MGRCGKSFALLLVITFIISLVILLPSVKAQVQGVITINVDGSIDPSTAPIQQTGDTYTLTGNLQQSLFVKRSNIVLNGNNYEIMQGEVSLNQLTNVTIENFKIAGTTEIGPFESISLVDTLNSIVANNSITGIWSIIAMNAETFTGIYVKGGGSNTFVGNNLVNNMQGMVFQDTSNNLIVGNNVTCGTNSENIYSEPGGVFFGDSSNNTIYHNNFRISVGGQAADSGSVNFWDDGYPSGGNYWSDYQTKYPHAQMIGDSGIGNVSYVIDSQNKDNYPLLAPFDYNLYLFRTTKPEIQLLFSENQNFSSNNVTLSFTVDKATSWIGYSLDGQPNATVSSNFTITNLTNGQHDIAIYANDTFGNMGVQKANFNVKLSTTSVNSPVTTQTLVIIAIVAVIAVLIASLLLVYRKHHKLVKKL